MNYKLPEIKVYRKGMPALQKPNPGPEQQFQGYHPQQQQQQQFQQFTPSSPQHFRQPQQQQFVGQMH